MRALIIDAIALAVLSAFVFAATGKPERPDPTPKKPPAVPQLKDVAGLTNWGTLTQAGKKITLRGHDHWEADGEIRRRADRWEIVLVWELLADGKRAPGVYTIANDGSLVGRWAYGEDTSVEPDGEIKGLAFHDSIRRVMVQID